MQYKALKIIKNLSIRYQTISLNKGLCETLLRINELQEYQVDYSTFTHHEVRNESKIYEV